MEHNNCQFEYSIQNRTSLVEMSAVKEILAKGSVEVKAEAKESRNESASRPNMTTQFNSALFANAMEL